MYEHIWEYEVQKLGEVKPVAFKASMEIFSSLQGNTGIFLSLQPSISHMSMISVPDTFASVVASAEATEQGME